MGNVINAESFRDSNAMWTHGGYSGSGNVESLIGSLYGRAAVVVGSGGSIEDILDQVEEVRFKLKPVIFAVNDIGLYLPCVDHWCSLHNEKLKHWYGVKTCEEREHWERIKTHTAIGATGGLHYYWHGLCPLFALSGYFAMQVAWIMGCSPIVLVGCPGDDTRRFFAKEPRKGFHYGHGGSAADNGMKRQLLDEMARIPEFKKSVRSTDGWTREFFGGLECL